MKKLYIPTMDELETMQSLGANVYSYILAKAIEVLIMEDVIYEDIDMFEKVYQELNEIPEILHSIGKLYPDRIEDNQEASNDAELCLSILKDIPSQDKSIYHLDKLRYFNQNIKEGPLFNPDIVLNTVRILDEKLLSCPTYRFYYKEPNTLLDSIFACDLEDPSILSKTKENLILIDPIYAIKLNEIDFNKEASEMHRIIFLLTRSISRFSARYRLDMKLGNEYQNKDILSKPDIKVKKLIRCLEYHKNNYQ